MSADAPQVTHNSTDSSTFSDLSVDINDRIGLAGDAERTFLIEAGVGLRYTGSSWDQTGPLWSVVADRDPLVGDVAFGDHRWVPHAGETIVGFPSTTPISNYYSKGGIASESATDVLRWAVNESRCVAGDAVFLTLAGNIYMLSGYPSSTVTLVASNALVSAVTPTPQRLWAVKHSGGYYLAYQNNAAGVTMAQVSLTGVLGSTFVITKGITSSGNGLLQLHYAYDPLTSDSILAVAGVNDTVYTYRINRTTWADSGHDAVFASGVAAEIVETPAVGIYAGAAYVAVSTVQTGAVPGSTNSGDVNIYTRNASASATVLTLYRRFQGEAFDALQPGIPSWRVWFAPVQYHGRLLFGVYHFAGAPTSINTFISPATWIIADITTNDTPFFFAAGEEGGCVAPRSVSATATTPGNKLAVAYLEGTRIDTFGVTSVRARRLELEAVAPQTAQANGVTVFSGQVSYSYDGRRSFETAWPISPNIRLDVIAGGSLPTGSRTFQACWVYVDAQGNHHRSSPSPKRTVSLTPGNQTVNVRVTLPQVTARPASTVFLEVYMTLANPSTTADLYLATNEALTPVATYVAAAQTVALSAEPMVGLTTQKALYTGGGILRNERPLANRGVALVGSRLWAADGYEAYASKLIQPGEGPSWAVSDSSLTLSVPSGLGKIRGIAGLDTMLLLLCENAVCVFSGSGPPDTGGPSDFSEPRSVYRAAGPAYPKDVCLARDAIAWVSHLGDAHLFGQGAQGQLLSRPVGNFNLGRPSFSPGSQKRHDLLAFTSRFSPDILVYDMELSQWYAWRITQTLLDLHGTDSLYALLDSEPWVGRFSGNGLYVDAFGDPLGIQAIIETRLVPLGHLGRLKSVKPLGKNVPAVASSLTLSVKSDRQAQAAPLNSQTFTVGGPSSQWPREELPELRLGNQRMESFCVSLVSQPFNLELRAVQLQAKKLNENPRQSRK